MNNEMQYEEILWELEEVEKLDLEKSEDAITESFGGGYFSLICC